MSNTPDVPSVIRPIPHCPNLPVPEPDGNMEYSSDSKHDDMTVVAGDDAYKPEDDGQSLLNYLIHVSKRNISWQQEQHSTGIETVREN